MKQIKYVNWGTTLPEEHKNYFKDIDEISRILAYDLESYCSTTAMNNKYAPVVKNTTIQVYQHKEKFGSVRIYCDFAVDYFVEWKYNLLSEQDRNKYTLEDFREMCLIQDMLHYRNSYLTMKSLFPHYWEAISCAADYHELLFETKEDYLAAMNDELENKRSTFLQDKKDEVFKLLKWS